MTGGSQPVDTAGREAEATLLCGWGQLRTQRALQACLSGMTRALEEDLTATNGTATNANCWIWVQISWRDLCCSGDGTVGVA